jgi:cell division protein DivIC
MKHKKRRGLQHRISVISISGVVLLLMLILGVGSISMQEKNQNYKAQEAALQEQIAAEIAREEEISELEAYVGSDKYVEDVAKEKLGLINPNEIIFKAEP